MGMKGGFWGYTRLGVIRPRLCFVDSSAIVLMSLCRNISIALATCNTGKTWTIMRGGYI